MLKFDSRMETLGNIIAVKINHKLKRFVIAHVIPLCITYAVESIMLDTDTQINNIRESDLIENGGLIVICYDEEELKD